MRISQHQRPASGAAKLLLVPGRRRRRLPSGDRPRRHVDQHGEIEDQRNAAVAEDAGAGDARHVAVVLGHRLDHDVLLAQHAIDDQSELAALRCRRSPASSRRAAARRLAAAASSTKRFPTSLPRSRRGRARSHWAGRARWSSGARQSQTISTTDSIGMAKTSPSISTIRLGRIASVSGSLIVSVVPWPGSLSSSTVPLRSSIFDLDDVHAHAAAGDLGDLLGRAEARLPDRVGRSGAASAFRRRLRRDDSFLDRLVADPLLVQSLAVVGHLDDDAVAAMEGVQRDRAFARLAGGQARLPATRCRGRPRCGPCGSAGRPTRRSSACRARSSRRGSPGECPCRWHA